MDRNDAYAAILRAAVEEHPELERSRPGSVEYTDAADSLADSLYRLCIEFGVAFNEFRRAVLGEVHNRYRTEAAEGGASTPEPEAAGGALLDHSEPHSGLVILALELMREDSSF